MSDLQVITGVSILISGYVQLQQGLSSYHWMVIVDLAWFSSLTHLACLTLLRNHLYDHPLQRLWRLLSMTALAILLTISLSFTGGHTWMYPAEVFPGGSESYEGITAYYYATLTVIDPAMCHLGSGSKSTLTYYGMIFSILLIIFGFVTRIIKLYRAISVNVCGKARAMLSIRARRLLRIVFTWCCSGSSHRSLKRTLFYRPLLTIFLVASLFLDGWSSMLLEVNSSLVCSFSCI